MKVSIGRVIEIDNLYIKVELFEKYISSYSVLNGKPIRIGGVSNIVTCGNFVYQVTSEKINETKDQNIYEKRLIQCVLLGYLKNKEYFEGTDGDTPNVYDVVYMAEEDVLRMVYSNISSGKTVSIGYYTFMQDIAFEIDINKMFASHILIVGTTGSGKSNTMAKLYESLFDVKDFSFDKSKFLIIDTNGEFSDSFISNSADVKQIIDAGKKKDGLKIPIQYIDDNNWGLILDATEKTQFPVIKSVMKRLKRYYNGDQGLQELVNEYISYTIKVIIGSYVQPNQRLLTLERIVDIAFSCLKNEKKEEYINILKLYHINNGRIVKNDSTPRFGEYLDDSQKLEDDLCAVELFNSDSFNVNVFHYLLHLEYLIRVYKYNITENNISPMLSRMSNKVDLLSNHLLPYRGEIHSLRTFIDDLFNGKPILIVNMENCTKELKTLFVSLLAEKIYSYSLEKKKNKEKGSYHLIIEEAHNYLSKKDTSKEDALYDNCLELFEKIIKEGRKYGLFMTVSTQRPSEINETIISQTHNFLIHKLVNPKDIQIIKSAVPFLDEMSYKMLPILSPGQCIATGTAFKKPNIVQVNMPVNKVNSKTVDLCSLWQYR